MTDAFQEALTKRVKQEKEHVAEIPHTLFLLLRRAALWPILAPEKA